MAAIDIVGSGCRERVTVSSSVEEKRDGRKSVCVWRARLQWLDDSCWRDPRRRAGDPPVLARAYTVGRLGMESKRENLGPRWSPAIPERSCAVDILLFITWAVSLSNRERGFVYLYFFNPCL